MQISNDGWYVAMAAVVRHAEFFMSIKHETLNSTDIRSDPAFWNLMRELMVTEARCVDACPYHVLSRV